MSTPNKISWNQLKKNMSKYMFTYSGTNLCSLIDGSLFEDEWDEWDEGDEGDEYGKEIYFNYAISNDDSDEPVDVRIRFDEQWEHYCGTRPIPTSWEDVPFIPLRGASAYFNLKRRGEEFITFYDKVDSRKLI